ncbi:MAG: hypothetical protein PHI12_09185 [Dehalococcoidales bacterium]|nr:hypothetical protein [Dehalococcoidales bacterium]
MKQPVVRTTLEEDFRELGLPIDMNETARRAGVQSEQGCGDDDEDEKEEQDGEKDDEKDGEEKTERKRVVKKESRKAKRSLKREQDGEDDEEDDEKKSEQDDEEDDEKEKYESRKRRSVKREQDDSEDDEKKSEQDGEDDDEDEKEKSESRKRSVRRYRKEQDGEEVIGWDNSDDDEEEDEVETESKKRRAVKEAKRKIRKEQDDDGEDDWTDDDEEEEPMESKRKRGVKKEDANDPIDGPYVTKELLDRIDALPFEAMQKEDFDELLSELKLKKLPKNNPALRKMAESVVRKIVGGAAKRMRKYRSGSMTKETVFKCPTGKRAIGEGPGRRPCVPSHAAVGSVGKLKREGRLKKLWRRMGSGRRSIMRSDRLARRRGESLMSPFAQELMQVTEGMTTSRSGLRDEIVERVIVILNLLNEEFADKSVYEIYEDAANTLIDAFEVGRLDEDVMDDNEFIAELEPVLKLITKSFAKVEDGELGNE